MGGERERRRGSEGAGSVRHFDLRDDEDVSGADREAAMRLVRLQAREGGDHDGAEDLLLGAPVAKAGAAGACHPNDADEIRAVFSSPEVRDAVGASYDGDDALKHAATKAIVGAVSFRDEYINDMLSMGHRLIRPELVGNLTRAERELVGRMRKAKATAPAVCDAVLEQRGVYRAEFIARLAPLVSSYAERYLVLVEERNKFRDLDPEMKKMKVAWLKKPETVDLVPIPDYMRKPKDFGKDWRLVDASVRDFLGELRSYGATFGPGTYGDHDSYSVDIWPTIPTDSRGFYEHDAAVDFFVKADRAAKALGCGWYAAYNDFEVARDVAAITGEHRIRYGFKHGPKPFVLHIHFDIRPSARSPSINPASGLAQDR